MTFAYAGIEGGELRRFLVCKFHYILAKGNLEQYLYCTGS